MASKRNNNRRHHRLPQIMLNLKRNNATATTQNVLYVVTYPVKLKPNSQMKYLQNNTSCNDTTLMTPATPAQIVSFCNSSTYVNFNTRFSSTYRDSVLLEEALEKEGLVISPNPNNGQFVLRIKQQKSILTGLQIFDNLGVVVFRQQTGNVALDNGYNKSITVRFAAGTYYLLATTKKGILKTKFVVIK